MYAVFQIAVDGRTGNAYYMRSAHPPASGMDFPNRRSPGNSRLERLL
jgi:hypothetical protein